MRKIYNLILKFFYSGPVAQLGGASVFNYDETLKAWSYQRVVGSNPIGPVSLFKCL